MRGHQDRDSEIDRLVNDGMLFRDAHSPSSVCTPSRYNLLTGRQAWDTGVGNGVTWTDDPLLIEDGQMTVASVLKSAGYATACVGKWHLGWGRAQDPETWRGPDWNGEVKPGPLEVGFDYQFWDSRRRRNSTKRVRGEPRLGRARSD